MSTIQGNYVFHRVIDYEMIWNKQFNLGRILNTCMETIQNIPYTLDAVVSYWDYPLSTILPLLNRNLNLSGPSLKSVFRCEHKYLSRLLQKECIPEYIPRFDVFDPRERNPLEHISLSFPFWVKPVKSASSSFGFYIANEADFHRCIEILRSKLGPFTLAFNDLLKQADLPESILSIDGYHCLAEEIISEGHQCTQEGYVYNGKVFIYGTLDSKRYEGKHKSCFRAYYYPSQAPESIVRKMTEISETVVARIEYDQGPFNIEYFWNPETQDIKFLEINPRISKSHCPLFHLVDGVSNQQVMVKTALNENPSMPHRQGEFRYAAKFMQRHFKDGVVKQVPSREEIESLMKTCPELRINLLLKSGERLSDMIYQDSYSYEIANIFLGGDSPEEIEQKYQNVKARLQYEIQ